MVAILTKNELKSSYAQEDGIFRTRSLSQQVKNSVDRSNSYSIVQLTAQCFPRRFLFLEITQLC